METLHIENFAGLKDVRIEVAPITVLIGPQATGKSIVSKLLFFFREAILNMDPFVSSTEPFGGGEWSPEHYRDMCESRFLRYFPQTAWGDGAAKITYLVGEHRLSLSIAERTDAASPGKIQVELSEFFSETFTKHAELLKGETQDAEDAEFDRKVALDRKFWKLLRDTLGDSQVVEPQFIPAGRSFFSQFQATIFRALEADVELDPFMVSFGAKLEGARMFLHRRGFYGKTRLPLPQQEAEWVTAQLPNAKTASAKILRAELEMDGKTETLRYPDGRRPRLAHGSSGQQEVLPLLLLLSRYALVPIKGAVGLHVEEPEAHLFPTAQRDLIEMMAEVFNLQKGRLTLFITTHSPYILTAFNNLLQSGVRYEDASGGVAKKLEAIVPRGRALRPGNVTAYAFDGGGAKRIMDGESHLIDASLIDQVSNDLAVEFDRLLWEE